MLEEEFEKFDNEIQFDEDYYENIKYFFDAYLSDSETRSIIDQKKYGSLATISSYLFNQITIIPEDLRDVILLYINKNIKLEQFS